MALATPAVTGGSCPGVLWGHRARRRILPAGSVVERNRDARHVVVRRGRWPALVLRAGGLRQTGRHLRRAGSQATDHSGAAAVHGLSREEQPASFKRTGAARVFPEADARAA